jgi:hypothetical protein
VSRVCLNSLLQVEERLLEANYFARRLAKHSDRERFGYELNTFLAAARSATFLLQREMARVPACAEWCNGQRLSEQLLTSLVRQLVGPQPARRDCRFGRRAAPRRQS